MTALLRLVVTALHINKITIRRAQLVRSGYTILACK